MTAKKPRYVGTVPARPPTPPLTGEQYRQAVKTSPCSTCGKSDMVEDSVSPEKWDGYCYRCGAPFKQTKGKMRR